MNPFKVLNALQVNFLRVGEIELSSSIQLVNDKKIYFLEGLFARRQNGIHTLVPYLMSTSKKNVSDSGIVRDATGISLAAVHEIIKSNLADAVTLIL